MTDTDKLAAELRDTCVDWDGDELPDTELARYEISCGKIRAILDDRDRLVAEVARCHARLEIDHAFKFGEGPDDLVRFEIPMEKRASFPDAVAARDATIALQDERCDRLAKRVQELEAALEPFADVADLIDAETEGVSDTDEFSLMFHDYLLTTYTLAQFRRARALKQEKAEALPNRGDAL